MIEYILSNKEWIFSGIGVFLLTLLISFLRKKKAAKRNYAKIKGSGNVVKQKSSRSDDNRLRIDGDLNKINQD